MQKGKQHPQALWGSLEDRQTPLNPIAYRINNNKRRSQPCSSRAPQSSQQRNLGWGSSKPPCSSPAPTRDRRSPPRSHLAALPPTAGTEVPLSSASRGRGERARPGSFQRQSGRDRARRVAEPRRNQAAPPQALQKEGFATSRKGVCGGERRWNGNLAQGSSSEMVPTQQQSLYRAPQHYEDFFPVAPSLPQFLGRFSQPGLRLRSWARSCPRHGAASEGCTAKGPKTPLCLRPRRQLPGPLPCPPSLSLLLGSRWQTPRGRAGGRGGGGQQRLPSCHFQICFGFAERTLIKQAKGLRLLLFGQK